MTASASLAVSDDGPATARLRGGFNFGQVVLTLKPGCSPPFSPWAYFVSPANGDHISYATYKKGVEIRYKQANGVKPDKPRVQASFLTRWLASGGLSRGNAGGNGAPAKN